MTTNRQRELKAIQEKVEALPEIAALVMAMFEALPEKKRAAIRKRAGELAETMRKPVPL